MDHVTRECGKMAIDSDGGQQQQLSGSLNFDYDTLLQLIEHLRACVDVCTSRTANWQKFCLWNEQVKPFCLAFFTSFYEKSLKNLPGWAAHLYNFQMVIFSYRQSYV